MNRSRASLGALGRPILAGPHSPLFWIDAGERLGFQGLWSWVVVQRLGA